MLAADCDFREVCLAHDPENWTFRHYSSLYSPNVLF